jgi:hypothetical protein
LVEPTQTGDGILDCVYRLLENNLLCRVIELLLRQPVQMHLGPMLASTIDPPVAQQKRQQLSAFAAKILRCRRARPDKIADRFMHPNRRQITGAQQPSQCHGIAPVGLDPLARSFGTNEGATTMQS